MPSKKEQFEIPQWMYQYSHADLSCLKTLAEFMRASHRLSPAGEELIEVLEGMDDQQLKMFCAAVNKICAGGAHK